MSITCNTKGVWELGDAFNKVNFNRWASMPTTLWGWGNSQTGQIGDDTSADHRKSPVQIPGNRWKCVTGDGDLAFGTKTDGTLWMWGDIPNSFYINYGNFVCSPVQVPGNQWYSADVGFAGESSYGIKYDGTLWVWGSLGTLSSEGQFLLNCPGDVAVTLSSPVQVPGTQWCYVTAGGKSVLLLKCDGTLWGGGENICGQLGDGTTVHRSSPVQIPGSWVDVNMRNASSADSTVYGRKADGTLWAWGKNDQGFTIPDNTNVVTSFSSPVQIPGTSWVKVAAGTNSIGALKSDGTLWVWGDGANGALGQNNTFDASSPIQIPGTNWIDISAAARNMSAVKSDNTLWGWGSACFVGDGDNNDKSSPIQIPGTNWHKVFYIKDRPTQWALKNC